MVKIYSDWKIEEQSSCHSESFFFFFLATYKDVDLRTTISNAENLPV